MNINATVKKYDTIEFWLRYVNNLYKKNPKNYKINQFCI